MQHAITIREGKKEDLPTVLKLVQELASFEKAPDEVKNSVASMELDGFGPNPVYWFFVAVLNEEIVGLSLYYWRYSTWKGKQLYLEDLIVTESVRGQGVGKLLFEKTMQHTLDQQCSGMMWQVLGWNEPAIDFYRKYGTKIGNTWLNCLLERDQISAVLKNSEKN
ncbi:MAG: GNAT family N-acetyltransferase [Chryseolinea sp.]